MWYVIVLSYDYFFKGWFLNLLLVYVPGVLDLYKSAKDVQIILHQFSRLYNYQVISFNFMLESHSIFLNFLILFLEINFYQDFKRVPSPLLGMFCRTQPSPHDIKSQKRKMQISVHCLILSGSCASKLLPSPSGDH